MQVRQTALTVADRTFHRGISFADYLAIPGYSYSKIKADTSKVPDQPTAKMSLGTKVHNYILEPSKYDHEDRELIKPMAVSVMGAIGNLAPYLESELAVTCNMMHTTEGFVLPYKGRIDLCRVGGIVVDLKVSKMPLLKSIPFFGYDRQLSGYALAAGCNIAVIIRVCPST